MACVKPSATRPATPPEAITSPVADHRPPPPAEEVVARALADAERGTGAPGTLGPERVLRAALRALIRRGAPAAEIATVRAGLRRLGRGEPEPEPAPEPAPDRAARARAEIDRILGDREPDEYEEILPHLLRWEHHYRNPGREKAYVERYGQEYVQRVADAQPGASHTLVHHVGQPVALLRERTSIEGVASSSYTDGESAVRGIRAALSSPQNQAALADFLAECEDESLPDHRVTLAVSTRMPTPVGYSILKDDRLVTASTALVFLVRDRSCPGIRVDDRLVLPGVRIKTTYPKYESGIDRDIPE